MWQDNFNMPISKKSRLVDNDIDVFEKRINADYSSVLDSFMVYYDNNMGCIVLTDLYVKLGARGVGIGSKIINELTQIANKLSLPIVLIPLSEGDSDDNLVGFYKKFNFVVNAGVHKNHELSIPSEQSLYKLPE